MSTTNDTDIATTDSATTDEQAVTEQPTPEEPAQDGPATEEQGGTAESEDASDVTQVTSQVSAETAKGGASPDLVREGEVAADFLETLLDIADLDGDLEVDVDGDRAAVALVDSEDGAAPRRLVGQGGSVLEALQELTRLAVQAETGERSRLMLDVAGYRADRRSALVGQARSAIAEVKESGERRDLEPMTAFERKVVHDEVLAAGLTSESEGVEPSRHVVILPAD
ncbi:R3H domain-containing nucleic acid-binding protein [uncultured Serinicoccus sp.]|uniref:Jag family protein n=1 Tax=uncultured Serinicoccus sp. TaxID=735514 RepID=UPI002637997D|nr:R3H domain-containing nucleic acid-binding protein [uncultured Serinicoccus sp.]